MAFSISQEVSTQAEPISPAVLRNHKSCETQRPTSRNHGSAESNAAESRPRYNPAKAVSPHGKSMTTLKKLSNELDFLILGSPTDAVGKRRLLSCASSPVVGWAVDLWDRKLEGRMRERYPSASLSNVCPSEENVRLNRHSSEQILKPAFVRIDEARVPVQTLPDEALNIFSSASVATTSEGMIFCPKHDIPCSEDKILDTLMTSAYNYEGFKDLISQLPDKPHFDEIKVSSEKLQSDAEHKLRDCEHTVRNVFSTEDDVIEDKIASFVGLALQYKSILNPYLFGASELRPPHIYWANMSMLHVTTLLAVLFSELKKVPQLTTPDSNILFSGSGLGDWAVATALFASETNVFCVNRREGRNHDAAYGIFAENDAAIIFDEAQLKAKRLWNRAVDLKNGNGLRFVSLEPGLETSIQRFQSKVDNSISAVGKDSLNKHFGAPSAVAPSVEEFLTTVDIGSIAREILRAPPKLTSSNSFQLTKPGFDVVVMGNCVQPDELHLIRDGLNSESNGAAFALIPVSERINETATQKVSDFIDAMETQYPEMAPKRKFQYCSGSWWLIRKDTGLHGKDADVSSFPTKNDKKLFPFPAVMRPDGAKEILPLSVD